MELKTILFSQIAWPGRLLLPIGGLHLERTVEVMRKNFKFVEGPKRLEDFDPTRGVIFKHGEFRSGELKSKQFVIGELHIYTNGILINSQASTEDMDTFLELWLKIVEKELQAGFIPDTEKRKTYTSHLELEMEKSLPVTEFEMHLAQLLTERLPTKMIPTLQFEKSGFTIAFDASHRPALLPSRFSFARRDGFPYSSNLYFSEAPLPTVEHLSILLEFEKTLPG